MSVMSANGCTYTGQASVDLSQLARPVANKIPQRVALIQNQALKSKRFSASNAGIGVEIDFYPALVTGLRAAFISIFDSVRVIDDPTAAEAGELLAFFDFDVVETHRNEMTAHFIYATRLTVAFRDSPPRVTLAEYHHDDTVDYSPSAETTISSVLTGATLYMAAPITMAWGADAAGRHAQDLTTSVLSTSLLAITDQILADDRLHRDARGAEPVTRASPSSIDSLVHSQQRAAPKSAYDALLDAVVVIEADAAIATGFFVNPSGLLLTNYHVVEGASSVLVHRRDGEILTGSVVAYSREHDLALISADGGPFPFITLAESDEGGLGDDVIAIGTPEGLAWSVTRGIVSAVRDIDGTRYYQTDAAINHGNSGGPLILLRSGRAVGVNTLMFAKNVAEGLNFAVSASDARFVFSRYLATTAR